MQRKHAHRQLLPARQQRVVLALQQCSAVRRNIKTVVGAIVRGIVRQEPHIQRLPGARGNTQIQGGAAGGGNAIERALHACDIDGGRAVIAVVAAYRRRGAEQGQHAIAIPGVGPGQPGQGDQQIHQQAPGTEHRVQAPQKLRPCRRHSTTHHVRGLHHRRGQRRYSPDAQKNSKISAHAPVTACPRLPAVRLRCRSSMKANAALSRGGATRSPV